MRRISTEDARTVWSQSFLGAACAASIRGSNNHSIQAHGETRPPCTTRADMLHALPIHQLPRPQTPNGRHEAALSAPATAAAAGCATLQAI